MLRLNILQYLTEILRQYFVCNERLESLLTFCRCGYVGMWVWVCGYSVLCGYILPNTDRLNFIHTYINFRINIIYRVYNIIRGKKNEHP